MVKNHQGFSTIGLGYEETPRPQTQCHFPFKRQQAWFGSKKPKETDQIQGTNSEPPPTASTLELETY